MAWAWQTPAADGAVAAVPTREATGATHEAAVQVFLTSDFPAWRDALLQEASIGLRTPASADQPSHTAEILARSCGPLDPAAKLMERAKQTEIRQAGTRNLESFLAGRAAVDSKAESDVERARALVEETRLFVGIVRRDAQQRMLDLDTYLTIEYAKGPLQACFPDGVRVLCANPQMSYGKGVDVVYPIVPEEHPNYKNALAAHDDAKLRLLDTIMQDYNRQPLEERQRRHEAYQRAVREFNENSRNWAPARLEEGERAMLPRGLRIDPARYVMTRPH